MRMQDVIQEDIYKAKKEIEEANKELETQKKLLKYDNTPDSEDLIVFWPLLWLAVAVACIIFEPRVPNAAAIPLRIGFYVAPFLALFFAIGFVCRELSTLCLRFALIASILLIGGLFFAIVWIDRNTDPETNDLTMLYIPIFFGLVVQLILLIGSFVKLLLRKRDNRRRNSEIEKQQEIVQDAEARIQALEDEKVRSLQAADALYREEIFKDTPDMTKLMRAAKHGSVEAGLAVAIDFAQQLLSGQLLNDAQVNDVGRKVGEYADLARGCSNEKLRGILSIWAQACMNYPDYEAYGESAKTLAAMRNDRQRAKALLSDESELVRLVAEDAERKLADAEKKADAYYERRQEEQRLAAALRKLAGSGSSGGSYSGSSYGSSYSGSSYGSGALSHSQMQEYIDSHSSGLWSMSAISEIENDSSLTSSQKEQLKQHLKIWGD